MGLFGSGSKTTKTTVKPSKDVENILKQVTDLTRNYDSGDYINRQVADLSPQMQAALSGLSQSKVLQNISNMYSGRTGTGLNQLNNINSQLQGLASGGGVTGKQALDYRNTLNNSALAGKVNSSSSSSSLGGNTSAALKRQNATGNQRNQALTNLSRNQSALGMGINNLQSGQSNQLSTLGKMNSLAGTNLNLGSAGTQAGQQAIQNQLNAGNYQQQYNQLVNDNNWQNQMGQQQWDWNQLNNKLNVLNSISPMAGYTTTGQTPGISSSQQMLGYGTSALGALGSRYFSNGATAARSNGVGGMQSMQAQSANNAQGYTMPQQAGGFWGNLGQGFGSLFNAN